MQQPDSKDQDFETDRGSGAIVTAFVVLALVAVAALYTLYPVDRDTNGKDVPQARVSQTAPDSGTTGMSR